MTDDNDAGEELVSQLRIVEGQPLAERAEAYGLLHEQLSRRLEGRPVDGGSSEQARSSR